jgi:signal transduction histidine kinase
LRQVAELIAPLAVVQKNLSLSGTQGPCASEEMLHRAIRNLVENAIKHATGHRRRNQLSEGISERARSWPRRYRCRAGVHFERFWRRDRRQAEGAGLGLSIVKRIVESHGGTIAIKDRSNGGTRFSVSFIPA